MTEKKVEICFKKWEERGKRKEMGKRRNVYVANACVEVLERYEKKAKKMKQEKSCAG